MIETVLPQIADRDLLNLENHFICMLSETDMLEEFLDEVEPDRKQAIMAWLEEHGIHSDIECIWNIKCLREELKEEWHPFCN